MEKILRGQNNVELQGEVRKIHCGSTQSGYPFFKCRLGIPLPVKIGKREEITKNNYVPIIAWGNLAESMDEEVFEGAWIKVIGHIQEKSYTYTCRNCGTKSNKRYVEVSVSNYLLVDGGKNAKTY